MPLQAGAAGLDRLLVTAHAAELFGERRESNRRRIQLDPASKLLYPRIVRHQLFHCSRHGVTVTDLVVMDVRPRSSVTDRRTVYVPARVNR